MAGRAKGLKARKHPNDLLVGGEACRECGKEFTILSSYKRHLINVHRLSQGESEEIVEATKKKFFPEEERFPTKNPTQHQVAGHTSLLSPASLCT